MEAGGDRKTHWSAAEIREIAERLGIAGPAMTFGSIGTAPEGLSAAQIGELMFILAGVPDDFGSVRGRL